ncbi:MAG TPA: nitroreductase family deazaflavin-dependent oxidoreductase [Jiangellaceae bacterium]|nr:nitroreductase family deazaflavin-dependent oxidoreductase [Jiangellaceae bacterium]
MYGQEHVEAYRATDGERGYSWNGTQTLLLTTTGRRTGQARTTPLIFAEHAGGHAVVASYGGNAQHPAWYLNLQANPTVTVQIKGEVFQATARTATPQEKSELWPIMAREWPAYDDYQAKTTREIPIVVLERS